MRARWWAEGAGLALLIMLPYFFPLVTPGEIALYHQQLPLRSLIFGILLDLTALSLVFVVILMFVGRLPARARLMTGAVLAAGVLWRAAIITTNLTEASQSNLDGNGAVSPSRVLPVLQAGMRLNHAVAAGMVLLFLLLAMTTPRLMLGLIRVTRIGLAGFALSMVWLVPQLIYLATRPGEPRVRAAEVGGLPVVANDAPEGRVVWILLDELSYRLVFEERPDGQEFPNLERLRKQSFSFGNIEPIGFYTDRIVPSLLAGKEMDDIRSTATGELEYVVPGGRHWEAFDPESSLFGLAKRNGWNSGIAGWHNPYCRILASTLGECSWRPTPAVGLDVFGASTTRSVTANALVLPRYGLARLSGRAGDDSQEMRERDIESYRKLMEEASALLQNQQINFVFLHLPVPHPPGIYDRRSHRLRAGGNYLDNLTLADDTLGELMREIGESADAGRTTIIVSSDHSWRVPLWDTGPDWTNEEEQISQRKFDPRPVFLVHFPGQAKNVEVQTAVPELDEHEIIAAILNRQVRSGTQFAALLGTEKIRVAEYEAERSAAGQ